MCVSLCVVFFPNYVHSAPWSRRQDYTTFRQLWRTAYGESPGSFTNCRYLVSFSRNLWSKKWSLTRPELVTWCNSVQVPYIYTMRSERFLFPKLSSCEFESRCCQDATLLSHGGTRCVCVCVCVFEVARLAQFGRAQDS